MEERRKLKMTAKLKLYRLSKMQKENMNLILDIPVWPRVKNPTQTRHWFTRPQGLYNKPWRSGHLSK